MKKEFLLCLLLSGILPVPAWGQSVQGSPFDFQVVEATDCRANQLTLVQGQFCLELNDQDTWRCSNPLGGTSDTFCDQADDWVLITPGATTLATPDSGPNEVTDPLDWSKIKNIPGTTTGPFHQLMAETEPCPANSYVINWDIDGTISCSQPTAGQIINAPAGSIAATTAQQALEELDTEKQAAHARLTELSNLVCPSGIVEFVAGAMTCGVDDTGAGGVSTGVKGGINVVDANTDWQVVNDHVTNARLANMGEATIKGRALGAGTGDPTDLTATQVATLLDAQIATQAELNAVAANTPTLQEVCTAGCVVNTAIDPGSAVRFGGVSVFELIYGNATDGLVHAVSPAQNINQNLAPGFDYNFRAADSSPILNIDNDTKVVTVTNPLVASITGNAVTATGFSANRANCPAGQAARGVDELGAAEDCFMPSPGSGSPGGSTSQLQYNNGGAFAGILGATSNGTFVTLNSPVLVTPVLGTPSNLTLTNATGLPISTGVSGLGSGVAPFLATPSSANLATALTDEVDTSGGFMRIGSGRVAIPWSAAGVETDGTNCATQTVNTINSGIKVQDFGCVPFATGVGSFYGLLEMRPAWSTATTLTFTFRLRTIGTTSKTWKADVVLYCLGDNEAYPSNTTLDGVTPQEISITTGTTPTVRKSVTTAAITPGNTCAANDSLLFRVQTKSGHDATSTEAMVLGGSVNATYSRFGD